MNDAPTLAQILETIITSKTNACKQNLKKCRIASPTNKTKKRK